MGTELKITVADKESCPNAEDSSAVGQARKPWSAPVLMVSSIEAVTQNAANTVSDGTGNLYS
jgi:hypothetical protein